MVLDYQCVYFFLLKFGLDAFMSAIFFFLFTSWSCSSTSTWIAFPILVMLWETILVIIFYRLASVSLNFKLTSCEYQTCVFLFKMFLMCGLPHLKEVSFVLVVIWSVMLHLVCASFIHVSLFFFCCFKSWALHAVQLLIRWLVIYSSKFLSSKMRFCFCFPSFFFIYLKALSNTCSSGHGVVKLQQGHVNIPSNRRVICGFSSCSLPQGVYQLSVSYVTL